MSVPVGVTYGTAVEMGLTMVRCVCGAWLGGSYTQEEAIFLGWNRTMVCPTHARCADEDLAGIRARFDADQRAMSGARRT